MPQVKNRPQDLREKQITNAIRAFRNGNYPSISATAVAFDLPKSTLAYRMSGQRVSRQKAHVDQQLLTEAEERALVRWIKRLDDWGFPPRLDMVKEMARMLVGKKKEGLISMEGGSIGLGKNWLSRFLDRHKDIASRYSSNLERQRAYANDPKTINDYFRKYNRIRIQHAIEPEDIYNLDEKGFMMGMSAKTKVVTNLKVGRRNPWVTHDGKRELITDLETIRASGTFLPPFLIFKA